MAQKKKSKSILKRLQAQVKGKLKVNPKGALKSVAKKNKALKDSLNWDSGE